MAAGLIAKATPSDSAPHRAPGGAPSPGGSAGTRCAQGWPLRRSCPVRQLLHVEQACELSCCIFLWVLSYLVFVRPFQENYYSKIYM